MKKVFIAGFAIALIVGLGLWSQQKVEHNEANNEPVAFKSQSFLNNLPISSNSGNPGGSARNTPAGNYSYSNPATSNQLGSFSNPYPIPASEQQALNDLFVATNGVNWINNSGWTSPLSVSSSSHSHYYEGYQTSYYGIRALPKMVACESPRTVPNGCYQRRISDIKLIANNLLGELPLSIGDFPFLGHMRISSNQLYGNIPSSIGNLSNLYHLRIDFNSFCGTLPESLMSIQGNTTPWGANLTINIRGNNLDVQNPSSYSSAFWNNFILHYNLNRYQSVPYTCPLNTNTGAGGNGGGGSNAGNTGSPSGSIYTFPSNGSYGN